MKTEAITMVNVVFSFIPSKVKLVRSKVVIRNRKMREFIPNLTQRLYTTMLARKQLKMQNMTENIDESILSPSKFNESWRS
jgi:hypothetical protein